MSKQELKKGFEPIIITETRPYEAFETVESKLRVKFFGEIVDQENPDFCYSTLWTTRAGGVPLKPIATYWLRRKDRNGQTWNWWSKRGNIFKLLLKGSAWNPEPITLYGKKVPLNVKQVRWTRMWYHLGPVIYVALVALAASLNWIYLSRAGYGD